VIGLRDSLDQIRSKTPFFGHVRFNYGWSEAIQFLDTHPEKLLDMNEGKYRVSLNASHTRGSFPKFGHELIAEMNELFPKNENTCICFIGMGSQNFSYPWHKDGMDVILVQGLGNIDLKVENTNFAESPLQFAPGDWVFIPRGTHHEISTSSSRLTFSFGVERVPDPSTYV
jgi:hypothetical protein